MVNAASDPVALKGATYEFVREIVDYRWYQVDGEWRYDRIVRDRIISGGTVDIGADAPAKLSARVEWAAIARRSPIPSPACARRCASGPAGAPALQDRPDRPTVSSDKPGYKAGDTATVNVRSAVDGKVCW